MRIITIKSNTFAAELAEWAMDMYISSSRQDFAPDQWQAVAKGYPDGHVELYDIVHCHNTSAESNNMDAVEVLRVHGWAYTDAALMMLSNNNICCEDDYDDDAREDGIAYLPADEYEERVNAIADDMMRKDAEARYNSDGAEITAAIRAYAATYKLWRYAGGKIDISDKSSTAKETVSGILAKLPVEDLLALYRACTEAQSGRRHAKSLFEVYFRPATSMADYYFILSICYDLLPINVRDLEDGYNQHELSAGILAQRLSKISVLRAERGLTRKQLAEMSGVDVHKIVHYEGMTGGAREMAQDTAKKLADALGVSPDELI